MVEDMSGMFQDCLAFDSDITKWDVSNVRDMSYMFSNNRLKECTWNPKWTQSFNVCVRPSNPSKILLQPRYFGWNVRSVLDMTGMFIIPILL